MKDQSTQEAKHSIATAAEDAIKIITQIASEAAKVVATATAEAAKLSDAKKSGDHDLLIKLDTKVDALSVQIKELQDNNAKRIDALESEKLNTKDSYPVLYKEAVDKCLTDHEDRIRKNTVKLTVIMTVGGAIGFAVAVVEFILNKWY